jgi:ComF family protein
MSAGIESSANGRLGRLVSGVIRRLLDFAFPPLCAACRTPVGEAHSLCGQCWRKITFFDGPGCAICGFPFEFDPGAETLCAACQGRPPAFDRAQAVMHYDPASRDPILAFKRADRLDLAPAFAGWLERSGRGLLAEADMIVPVPLHWSRLWQRRYNQSAELGRSLARLTGVPCESGLLERVRPTKSQGEMPSAKARRRNVLGAFRVCPRHRAMVKGRTVLLLDDVYTTGSTVGACARVLKRAGAAKVLVLTLARVVRPMSSYI